MDGGCDVRSLAASSLLSAASADVAAYPRLILTTGFQGTPRH